MASTKKSVSDIENRIGTTESGEISYNLDAFDRLYKGNVSQKDVCINAYIVIGKISYVY